MKQYESGALIIYKSADRETWEPVLNSEVPEWVKDPDILGRMVDGEACHDDDDPASPWYIAKRVVNGADQSAMLAAKAKRERRCRIRLAHDRATSDSRILH